ncbi:MAG: filamentous hemagglutinin N-terminal domain-containing protein, partial [Rhodopseudomonas sp.]|nr:filamentous hemagglutinin N-terminal domain-containing protein [Rhodopseudomonas sp.]
MRAVEGNQARIHFCRLHLPAAGLARSVRRLVDRFVALTSIFVFAIAPILAHATELPTGGSVAAGSATISSPNSSTLNVNQSTDRAIINWNSFSVGAGGTVNFNQPSAASATLNRVTGDTPSSIAGIINAPGTVLLVNPNGVAITKDGVVNVGSFAASTLDIKNDDFMSGNYRFTGNGASADVSNAGRINVSDGGFAALLGGHVANDGVISARLGKVGLGSGELITLDLAGDGFMSVAVPTSVLGDIKDGQGRALVSNKGKIVADGGVVYLSAATAAGLLRDAVYVPGSIRANSVGTRNGKIVIGGGAGGRVRVAGRVRASGHHGKSAGSVTVTGADVAVSGNVSANGGTGGSVTVAGDQATSVDGSISAKGSNGQGGVVILTADQVTLGSSAKVDVSGLSGGTLLIGGDYQGGANAANDFSITPVKNALTTSIASGATLDASGTDGDGGHIVVWSDDHTTFAGALSVASANGSGGFAEVSGHKLLDFTGTVDLAGTAGAGTLLLDPENITISSGSDSGVTASGGTYTASADSSVLSVATLQAALASGNVIVTTGGAGSAGSQAGDITVANDVTWSSVNSLTLSAYRNIAVNANVTSTGGASVILLADNSGKGTGAVSFGSGNAISTSGAVSIYYDPTGNNATTVNTTSYKTPTDYSGNVTGGGTLTSYMLVNTVYDLQNIQNNLSANYALGRDIDASATSSWNSSAGFVPLGTSTTGFSGSFDGQYHIISGLTIKRATTDNVGLFGYVGGANSTIVRVGLTGVSVTGRNHVGALVGAVYSGSVTDSFATGVVSGSNQIGGLIGQTQGHAGIFTRLYSDVAVIGATSSTDIGGVVGQLSNDLTQAYASGAVSGGGSSGNGGLTGGGSPTATVTYGYYDTSTAGNPVNGGGTGETTAQLQAALPTGFDSNWAIVAGQSYAYLKGFYASGTPQVISGYAFTNSGVTGASGATVSALVDGASVGSAIAGSNGYYNILVASGTIASAGSTLLAYTTGTNGGAHIETATGSTSGVDIWGKTLIAPTTATTYSAASATTLQSQDAALITTAVGSNTTVATLIGGLTSYGYVATGSGFTIDTTPASAGLYAETTATGAGITVNAPITIASGSGLTLDAAGALDVNAAITAKGTAAVKFGYDSSDPTNLSFALGASGFTGSLTYMSSAGAAITASAGGTLMINDASYTLLYDMGSGASGVQGINNGLAGNYALAISLNAASTSGFVALGTDGAGNILNGLHGFSGHFNGLGHTISNLTVDTGTHYYAGLFGVQSGAIAGIGLVGGSTNGYADVGALVGYNYIGSVTNAYATGTVTDVFDAVGGLVGYNQAGVIANVYATGAVSGTSGGGGPGGGLVGRNTGSITNAYATGSVSGVGSYAGGLVGSNDGSNGGTSGTITNVYATGAVTSAGYQVGGLVGSSKKGSITDAYATGAVSGLGNVGGLIGYIDRGTITDTYATGAVTSTDTTTGGGFVGTEAYLNGYPTITDSYWNTETTGLTKATGKATNLSGVTGLTTAQLQGMAASGNIDIATGFANAGWAGGTGGLYPYLTVFYPNGAEAVSGTAFSDAGVTALGSSASSLVKVAVVINGQQVGSAITGANGYYYVMLPAGTVSGSTGVLTYLASGGTTGSGFTDSVSAAVAGLNIYGNTLRMVTADANLSTATGNLATAKGSLSLSALPYSVTGGALTTTAGNVEIDATGSAFTVDRSITAVGTLLVNVANGSLTLASGTLKSSATGNAIVLVDGTTFTNSVGASALSAASGRWLIYSQAEASDNVGGLTGGTIYSSTYAANPPSSISASGNQFVYASGPSTLLISGYVYSDLGATLVGSGVTVNALINGVSVGATTTGSGGEYQFSVASSLLDGSKMLITYTTGATGGVALAENASGVISNLNIYGNALTTATASSNLSTVNANLATAIGGVSGVPSSYANLFVNATGSSFMIDQALNSLSTNLYLNGTSTTQLGATAAINVGSFNLQGGNWVQTGALPGFAATSFTISGGSFLRVAGGDGSSAAPYQVADVYGLQGIGSSTAFLAADWQLANDIDASGTANWNGGAGFVPIGNLTNGFYGSFDGRNYTISGLTINRPSADNVGLFGYATATGSITSVGLSSVAVTGGDNVGGLVGLLEGLASVTNAYVSGSVSGNDSVGGLIGSSDAATVGSSYSNSSVDGNSYVGGLVGTLTHGTINASYAAGSVHGYTKVGGLVGGVGQAFLGVLPKIKDSYAAATVTADTDVAGGLVGENLGSVQRSYASGAVTGRDSIGGLIGWNGSSGIIAASYWDTGTTGVGVAIGLDQNATSQSGNIAGLATALATTQACYTGTGCGGAGGWDFTNIWGIVEGQSHPYFLWQYPASGGTPQVVSGKAYSNFGTTAASGVAVNALVNGTNVGNVLAGANGYYELLVAPGTIAANSQLAVYTTGTTGGLSYRQDVAAGSQTAFNINGTYLTETSAASALSGISSGLLTAIGSNGVSTSYANRSIITSAANFTIDEAITQSGILRISTLGGNISQSAGAALNVNVLQLQVVGNGAPVATLADTNNQFASLGFANLGSGSLNLYDSVSLASGSVTANGGVLIRTAGSLTLNSGAQIASSASGNAVVLDAASNFINNSGSSAISTPGGRWIVYSAAVGGDVFGNLDSGNHAIFNFASDGLPYGDVPAGNRYVFQEQPVLTVTSTGATKTYGDVADISSNYTITGFQGVANAFLTDTAASVGITGAPTLSSTGTAASANVIGGGYTINVVDSGTLGTSGYGGGYVFSNFVSSGKLTVNPATITLAGTKTYDGGTAFSATNFGTNGVISTGINGETLTLSGSGSVASADVSAGTQALTLGSLALANGSGLASNYQIAVAGNTGKITQALLTLTITPDAATKVYGDTLTFAGTEYSQTGLVSGDAISGVTLTSTGTVATANVGHYDIVSSNAVFSSGSASNYNITYVTLTNGLTVTARPLTVTADAQSRVYGDANPTLTYQVGGSGLVNGDTLSGVLATVATTTSNIG